MAKVIENTSISQHNAEALVINSLDDFSKADAEWIKVHYEGIERDLAELQAEPEWTLGKILPTKYADTSSGDLRQVIFVQICQPDGKPAYDGVRACIQKIVENVGKIGAKHLAMGRLGCREGGIHIGALEPVVASAEGGKLMVDIYRGE